MSSDELITHIKHLYHTYRHTSDIDRKGLFFSKTCLQICRPTPSYAATTRNEIVQYLKDAQKGRVPVESSSSVTDENPETLKDTIEKEATKTKGKDAYTIRPLKPSEFEFGKPEHTAPVGLTVGELEELARREEWIGMRVDLWQERGQDNSLLVKVQYWWRREKVPEDEQFEGESDGFGWRQCLHDIMYLGPKDGTEGEEGLEVRE
ncbi:hypothetical protein IQ07DRAFT_583774 [Pyrenochaeta sp. DS3sAY3a]|nr:hypothetical protein IQ07DRAFT_583774 [Pyrenochaeta sp. DS3sAY3a]